MIAPVVALLGLVVTVAGLLESSRQDRLFWDAQRKLGFWNGSGPDPLKEMQRHNEQQRRCLSIAMAGFVVAIVAVLFVGPVGHDKQTNAPVAERMP